MKNIKVYYRVYDGIGNEVFASKKLSNCLSYVQEYKSLFFSPYFIRRIVYDVTDSDFAIVKTNHLLQIIPV